MNPDAKKLEDVLARALEREPAPAGFAERVKWRVTQYELQRERERKRSAALRTWLAIAAMLLLAVITATSVRRYEARQRIIAAKAGRELFIALKITGNKLQATQRMIRRKTNGA